MRTWLSVLLLVLVLFWLVVVIRNGNAGVCSVCYSKKSLKQNNTLKKRVCSFSSAGWPRVRQGDVRCTLSRHNANIAFARVHAWVVGASNVFVYKSTSCFETVVQVSSPPLLLALDLVGWPGLATKTRQIYPVRYSFSFIFLTLKGIHGSKAHESGSETPFFYYHVCRIDLHC